MLRIPRRNDLGDQIEKEKRILNLVKQHLSVQYAGHMMTSPEGIVSGIIDWSTGHVSDPSQDFSGHMTVFGEKGLKELITEYEKQGGKVWSRLYEQVVERAAAAPLAYGFFAVETQGENHIIAAKKQLGVG